MDELQALHFHWLHKTLGTGCLDAENRNMLVLVIKVTAHEESPCQNLYPTNDIMAETENICSKTNKTKHILKKKTQHAQFYKPGMVVCRMMTLQSTRFRATNKIYKQKPQAKLNTCVHVHIFMLHEC